MKTWLRQMTNPLKPPEIFHTLVQASDEVV